MRSYLFGLVTGLLMAAIILIGWPFISQPTTVGRLPTTSQSNQSAATATNLSQALPTSQQFPLTIAISDSGGANPNDPTTNLTSLSVTFSQAEIVVTSFANPTLQIPSAHREVLNLTQPTVELMSLRGSGALAELASINLAAGTYRTLELTISSLRGRRSDGQIFVLPVVPKIALLSIPLNQNWPATTPVQIVIDLDSLAGLTQSGSSYSFSPVVRRILVNDQFLASS